jgi:hypothetical protein
MAVVIGALALAGCAANAETQRSREAEAAFYLDKELKGRVAGAPQTCIDGSRADHPMIIDERTLLYRDGARIWRNDLESTCTGLDDDKILIVERHGSQACRNDTFRLQDRGSAIPGRWCRLGKFTPYTKVKKPG